MKRIFKIFQQVKSKLNKYWVAFGLFVIFTFFLGDSTIYKRIIYDQQINQLEKEIDIFTKQKEENQQKLDALRSDNESLERLAREQYQMIRPNEELFIIKE
ncbi:MAG: septum formation initiator family protein [Candidatus Azobacteroides sp.]|nr:septum formation initiator family protein [Candidatus Azobacteroides sp.]